MATTTTVRRQTRRPRWGLAAGMLAGATVSAAALTAAGPATTVGATRAHAQTVEVSTAKVAHVGTVLTTGAGLTLYRFEKDPVGHATCSGACAKIWPPFLATKGAHVKGPKGVKGLSLIRVGGGHWQVAFDHVALYRFEGDKKKGQAKGQGFAGIWFVALKSGIPAMKLQPAAPPPATPATPATPASPSTQPATPTTQPSATSTAPAEPAPAEPAPTTPVTAPTPTTPPTAPPPPSPPMTTLPPATTNTTAPSGGGVGF
jgi:predicted lipoprotein with Yx(FWY)xxD motif